MTENTGEHTQAELPLAGGDVAVLLLSEFLEADARRPTSFVTNFGDWQLPDAAAAALGSPVAHLEWFHDTGELVAIGGIPHRGGATVEIPRSDGAVDEIVDLAAGPFGGGGASYRTAAGAVREFPEMVVAEGTRVAVLAVVEHGPRVHTLLWDWHRRHRQPQGWTWLEDRVAAARPSSGGSD
jgi:hypothetical protein